MGKIRKGIYMYQVKISVRNLVEFIFRSGDISSGEGISFKDAMQAGSKIHRKIQGKMGLNYEAEVSLKYDVIRPHFVLTIEGRADGIITTEDGIVIDEIKGVYQKLDHIECPYFVHKAQVMCYAYIYAKEQNLPLISIQLTYCNLDTEEIKRFQELYTLEELEKWFLELIEDYSKWILFDLDHVKFRNASIEKLEFPYSYREGQKNMAGSVYLSIKRKKNLFVQAPTGIGKTMAALFPTIKAMGEGYGNKLFYLTAKTIGRNVAMEGLRHLRTKGLHFRSVLLTAKEKICPLEEMKCEAEHCPYAKGHFDRINEAIYDCITNEVDINREVILEYANIHKVCPFEMELDVSLFVDGIICDYNYVFDPRVRLKRYFSEGVKGEYIFLVDEAHNLVERASKMFSVELCKEDFLKMRRRLQPYHDKLGKLLASCNREFLLYKKEVKETGSYVLISELDNLYLKLLRLQAHLESFLEECKEIKTLKPYKDEILEFYFLVIHFNNIYEKIDDGYEIYAEQVKDDLFKIKLYCIHPANCLNECLEKGNATIFFSATMLPISYYKELLHYDEEDYAIYISSPFPQKNRTILIGTDVSSRYKLRGPKQYEKMARYISLMANAKSGNYMVFFPSYKMLNEVYEIAMRDELLEDLNVVLQIPNLSEEQREAFLKRFQNPKEPILAFCILGGIFSEGIDLVGDYLIGAMMIGTGLPMVCNERNIQMQYFDSRKQQGGFEYAYLYPGMNKVQQAAGRVIRTMQDRGVIILLDERFLSRKVMKTFPREWNDYQVVNLNNVENYLNMFWDL